MATTSDFLVERLGQWGVERIYGYPGDGINGIMAALRKADNVIEAITDPDTPTLPPHITIEQAKKFTQTLLKGDPSEIGIVKQAVKGIVQSLAPHAME